MKLLSFIPEGFKSLYRSGAAFTEEIAPKLLGKIGLPQKLASPAGKIAGGAIGVASIVTGATFLAAIPISLPMFVVASGIFASKGIGAAVFVTGFLGSVGTIVTTTGIGMLRAAGKAATGLFHRASHHQSKPVPEKTSFKGNVTAKADFDRQAKPAVAPQNPQARPAPQAPALN